MNSNAKSENKNIIELSGKQITGLEKLTERHTAEFDKIVQAVENCKTAPVRLDLSDLDISGLWRKKEFFNELALRPNLTLIIDPEMADMIKPYLIVRRENKL